MASEPIPAPLETQQVFAQALALSSPAVHLHEDKGWQRTLKSDGTGDVHGIQATLLQRVAHKAGTIYTRKPGPGVAVVDATKENTEDPTPSTQESSTGIQPHPFNMRECSRFQWQNEYHSACIAKKVSCTIGLGFRDGLKSVTDDTTGKVTKEYQMSKVDEALNKLCIGSFRAVLKACMEDYYQTDTAYLEIVRDAKNNVVGIHHVPAHTVFVNVEDTRYSYHYEAFPDSGTQNTTYFCAFGDKDSFLKRHGRKLNDEERMKVSELIAIRSPSSFSKWYGFPKWLSCVPRIELSQMSIQQRYDYYNNLACPEFMLFLLGKKLPKETWDAVTTSLKSTIGLGNAHKSLAVNIEDKDMKVQLEKLAMDSHGESSKDFADGLESLGRGILVAHNVPKLLVGISDAGKSGASNELTQSLMLFQWTTLEPVQSLVEMTLGSTLGAIVPGLDKNSFALVRLTDVLDLGIVPVQDEASLNGAGSQKPGGPAPDEAGGSGKGTVDVIGRARKPVGAGGRDPNAGLTQH